MLTEAESLARHAKLSATRRALIERRLANAATIQSAGGHATIPHRPPDALIPLSFAQERLWFLEQWQPGTATYNIPAPLRLRGPLQVAALECALNELIARHEVLRTTFGIADGNPVQVIAPTLTLPLPVLDLRDLPPTARETEMQRLMADAARRPFNLTQGPLLRATLLRLAETDHLLLLTTHHIVADGWSLGVLLRDLATCYEAAVAGQPVALLPLPIQYADYAVWQREWLHGEVLEGQLGYWRQQLVGAPATLELATDRPHPSVPIYRGATHPVVFSRAEATELKELSQREGVTLFMTLLAAFQALLARYSDQEDIVVGAPIAGRTRPEMEGLIGLFTNTLALRTNLAGDPTFRALLGRVRQVTLDAYAHQDLPFEQLVAALHPARDPSRNPLFQVMFTLQHAPLPATLGDLSVERLAVHTGTARFDMTLSLEETAQGIVGTIEYSTDLFEAATITRMMEHFHVLLRGIVADPEQHLSELPLLTGDERRQVLVEWSANKTEYPREQCIHQLFEAQVARTPDAIAVVFENQQLTYQELNVRANRLAQYLRLCGVGPETLVAICIERSLEMVIGLLGILKAGGAYVPLDPSYPKERLAFMLSDTQAPVLLTQARLVGALPEHLATVICLDTDWGKIAHESGANPVCTVTAANLAYIIYTSGSTGTPKGVMTPHRGVARLLFGVDYVHLNAAQRILQLATLSFDASTFELWGALLHGGRCVLFPEKDLTFEALGIVLRRHAITTLWLTASLFNAVIDNAPEALSGIEQLLIGGEALSVPHVRRAFQFLPNTQIINGYGPTENTTFACCYPIPQLPTEMMQSIPIGRPIGNTNVSILDKHLQPVPVGVPGELYIGGDGLARGYLNRPDLTAERFIPDPFGPEPEARLYKTGDLTRYLPDGNIEYLGRLDHQVKIRGFRIELGEIEAVLMTHPMIREALALAREDTPGDTRLVVYVVPAQGEEVNTNILRTYLKERLPAYMVPSAFVLLAAMPITPNGKVDRQALPAPRAMQRERAVSFVPPKSLLQLQLAHIWEELLDVRPVGITDDFFDLGGHSLLAARLATRMMDDFGKRIPLATLFSGATIAHLEAVLLHSAEHGPDSPVVQVQAGKAKQPFFFLHGDLRDSGLYSLKLARALDPDRPFYVIHPALTKGRPLPHTLEAIAAAHLDALRAIQPAGPYLLGGFCAGAHVAFEMAQQLQAQGEQADRLVMIEPDPANARARLAWRLITRGGALFGLEPEQRVRLFLLLRNEVKNRFLECLQTKRAELIATVNTLVTVHLARIARLLRPGARPVRLPAPFPTHEAPVFLSREAADRLGRHSWAIAGYRPRRYRGRIALFWAGERHVKPLSDPTKGWQAVADDIAVHFTPGGHTSMITTHVETLAKQLRVWLNTGEDAPPNESAMDDG